MNKLFYPKKIVDSIYNIDLNELYRKNIRGLIIDVDNTLVGHGVLEANQNVIDWIENAKKVGMKICIASNNSQQRIVKFNEHLKLPAIHKASKPRRKSFIKASEIMELKIEEIAVIGDQIFTDIIGGNRMGMYTIMVKPVDKNEPYYIKLKRVIEKFLLINYKDR